MTEAGVDYGVMAKRRVLRKRCETASIPPDAFPGLAQQSKRQARLRLRRHSKLRGFAVARGSRSSVAIEGTWDPWCASKTNMQFPTRLTRRAIVWRIDIDDCRVFFHKCAVLLSSSIRGSLCTLNPSTPRPNLSHQNPRTICHFMWASNEAGETIRPAYQKVGRE